MTDEDVVDPVKVRLEFHELHLRTLAAVDQKEVILNFNELRRRMSSVGRHGTARTEYGDLETHLRKAKNQNRFRVLVSAMLLEFGFNSSRRSSDPFRSRA